MFRFFKNRKSIFEATKTYFTLGMVILVLFAGLQLFTPDQVNAQGAFGTTDFNRAPPNLAGPVSPEVISKATDCNNLWVLDIAAGFGCALKAQLVFLMEAILRLSGWVLYGAGMLLKGVIIYSVNEMGAIVDSAGVRAAWSTFRDIANMSFIFTLLYIAINTILGTGNINMKKMLARVVIVAILLNFSFFFTKIAVDASNILTIGFYNQISNTVCVSGGQPAGDLGSAFMCKMGLPSFFDTKLISNFAGAVNDGDVGAIIVRGVVGSIFFLVAAFVFLATGIMFIIRFVSFIFLFILSPLAFAAMALPEDKYSKRWKEALINNCLFAPAVMLMFWATLKVLDAVTKVTNSNGSLAGIASSAGGAAPSVGVIGALLNYSITIAMIIGALVVAKEFGAAGAGGAMKMLSKAKNSVQGVIGRKTVGRAGAALDKRAGNTEFGNTQFGRALRAGTVGAMAKSGFGTKVGFKKAQEEKEKEDTKFANKKFEIQQGKANAKINVAKQKVTNLEENKETLAKQKAALTSDQMADINRLKNDPTLANLSNPERIQLQKTIKERAVEINNHSNTINLGSKKAQDEFDKLKTVSEEERKELFVRGGGEKEARAKGKSYGLSDADLELFIESEQTKFAEEIGKHIEKGELAEVELKRVAAGYSRESNAIKKGVAIGVTAGMAIAGPLGILPGIGLGAGMGALTRAITKNNEQHKMFMKAMRQGKKLTQKDDLRETFKKIMEDQGIKPDEGGGGDKGGGDKDKDKDK